MKIYSLLKEDATCPWCGTKSMALYTFITESVKGTWRTDAWVCTKCKHHQIYYVNANGYDQMTNPSAFVPPSHTDAIRRIKNGERLDDWTRKAVV